MGKKTIPAHQVIGLCRGYIYTEHDAAAKIADLLDQTTAFEEGHGSLAPQEIQKRVDGLWSIWCKLAEAELREREKQGKPAGDGC